MIKKLPFDASEAGPPGAAEGRLKRSRDVKVGKTYGVLEGGVLIPVQIVAESPFGGWDAIDVETARRVRITTFRHLFRRWDPPRDAGPDYTRMGLADQLMTLTSRVRPAIARLAEEIRAEAAPAPEPARKTEDSTSIPDWMERGNREGIAGVIVPLDELPPPPPTRTRPKGA
jgi:hypothetical protein